MIDDTKLIGNEELKEKISVVLTLIHIVCLYINKSLCTSMCCIHSQGFDGSYKLSPRFQELTHTIIIVFPQNT